MISKSIEDLRYSVIREMSGLAQGLPDVITLGIGEPDFHTPEMITEAAFKDAADGHTHYTHSQGDGELLKGLSVHIKKTMGIDLPPQQFLVTHGGMGSLTAAFRTLLEQGDEVLLPEPHFPDYLAHITFAGGSLNRVPTRFEEGFIPRPEALEAAITDKTRILLLNSPNNPTGAVIPGSVLDGIAKVAVKHDLLVISDEVYDALTHGDVCHESIYTRPGMAERTLVIKSFSKTYAMTGWRIGYCFGPESIIKNMLKVVNYSTACASAVGQRAALAALDLDPHVINSMRDRFSARLDLVCARLEKMQGIQVSRPNGSFYVFANIGPVLEKTGMDSREFAIGLIRSKQLVVVPGYAFGEKCDHCIRIACTVGREKLDQAMDRLQAHLTELMAG
ncbi:MAG: pyridoxal phosphate-dependent aminotransferase [Desulfobacterales bacterium]|nr:pyridoxal phosphate-dependent aminotransferase [Desulfobacterales bacterium]